MAVLQSKLSNGKSTSELEAMIAKLQQENEALKAKANRPLTMKVSDKGALSVYGLGRFPVTLYQQQWLKLIGLSDDIKAFIKANQDKLSVKE
jgi:hypothetical protein